MPLAQQTHRWRLVQRIADDPVTSSCLVGRRAHGARLTDERPVFLSTLPAGRGERRLGLAVVLTSVVVFLAAAPFAKVPLAPV